MSATWTIYCHVHVASGRKYVGLTKKTMLQRWNQHVYSAENRNLGSRSHFWAAIRTYGKDAFSHEVLEICDTFEAANAAEERWIAHFDSRNPAKGFNLAKGGQHFPHPVKNPWDRPEFRETNAGRNAHHLLTPESRTRQQVSLRSPESVAKRSALAAASMSSPSTLEKRRVMREDPSYSARISETLRRTLSDPAARAVASASLAAARSDPETVARKNENLKKAMSSPEVRAKLSASSRRAWSDPDKMVGMTGRRLSDETKAKISVASTGRSHTPESVERQRALYLERSSVCGFCDSRIDGRRSCVRGRVCCLSCRALQDGDLVSFLRPDGLPVL